MSSNINILPISIDCNEMFPWHKQPPVVTISSRGDIMSYAINRDGCIADWLAIHIQDKTIHSCVYLQHALLPLWRCFSYISSTKWQESRMWFTWDNEFKTIKMTSVMQNKTKQWDSLVLSQGNVSLTHLLHVCQQRVLVFHPVSWQLLNQRILATRYFHSDFKTAWVQVIPVLHASRYTIPHGTIGDSIFEPNDSGTTGCSLHHERMSLKQNYKVVYKPVTPAGIKKKRELKSIS